MRRMPSFSTPWTVWDDPRLRGHLRDVIYTLSYQETCDCASPNLPISPEIWLNLGRSRTISRNLPANRCVLDPQTHTSFARSLRDLSDEYSMWGSVSMTPTRTVAPPAAAPRPERRYLCIHSTFNRVYRGYIDPYTKKTHFCLDSKKYSMSWAPETPQKVIGPAAGSPHPTQVGSGRYNLKEGFRP